MFMENNQKIIVAARSFLVKKIFFLSFRSYNFNFLKIKNSI